VLYQRKGSPFWWYEFQCGGRRFRASAETSVEREARKVEREAHKRARDEVAAGKTAPRRRPITLAEAGLRYFEEVSRHTANAATDAYQLTALVEGIGKHVLLAEIDSDKLTAYIARRRGTLSRRGKPLSNASVNREVELLRRIIRRARLWKVDVGEDLPPWGELLLPEAAERVRELSIDEENRLFAALREDFHPMVDFALRTGIRLANVIGLTWSQVDYDANVIRLRLKSRQPGGKPHTVPLTRELKLFLAQQCKGHHPIYVFTFVCQTPRRGAKAKGERYPFSHSGWRRPWKAALKAAGVSDFRFHDTRHTAASRVLRTCGNLKVVQHLLGHSDIATTARYAHINGERDVADALENTGLKFQRQGPHKSPHTTAVGSGTD
jgi:integrase